MHAAGSHCGRAAVHASCMIMRLCMCMYTTQHSINATSQQAVALGHSRHASMPAALLLAPEAGQPCRQCATAHVADPRNDKQSMNTLN